MTPANELMNLAEEFLDIVSSLPNGLTDDDIRAVRRLAAEDSSADVWLQTSTLSMESRICLMASVAYTLHCLRNDPYKCAVFSRAAAEAFLEEEKSGS